MSLFRNPKKAVYAIALFLAVLVLAFMTDCHAADVSAGAGTTFVRGQAEVIDISVRSDRALPRAHDVTDAYWQASLTLIGSSVFREVEQPNQAAISGMLVDGFGNFDIGVGIVFLQNVDAYNGSHPNFCLKAGYRFSRLNLEYRHWSNAGTRYPNYGRDFVVLSYTF